MAKTKTKCKLSNCIENYLKVGTGDESSRHPSTCYLFSLHVSNRTFLARTAHMCPTITTVLRNCFFRKMSHQGPIITWAQSRCYMFYYLQAPLIQAQSSSSSQTFYHSTILRDHFPHFVSPHRHHSHSTTIINIAYVAVELSHSITPIDSALLAEPLQLMSQLLYLQVMYFLAQTSPSSLPSSYYLHRHYHCPFVHQHVYSSINPARSSLTWV